MSETLGLLPAWVSVGSTCLADQETPETYDTPCEPLCVGSIMESVAIAIADCLGEPLPQIAPALLLADVGSERALPGRSTVANRPRPYNLPPWGFGGLPASLRNQSSANVTTAAGTLSHTAPSTSPAMLSQSSGSAGGRVTSAGGSATPMIATTASISPQNSSAGEAAPTLVAAVKGFHRSSFATT